MRINHRTHAADPELPRLVRTCSEVGVGEWTARPPEQSQVRLQVVADQAGSKHIGDCRNRGKGGQPVWPITPPDRRGMEMRTFSE